MKTKLFNIISLACHGVLFALGIFVGIYCLINFNILRDAANAGSSSLSEGLGYALGAVALFLLMIIGFFYALVALIPLIMKIARIRKGKRGFDVVCIVFGFIFTAFHLFLIFSNPDAVFYAFLVPATIASVASTVLNFFTVRKPADPV